MHIIKFRISGGFAFFKNPEVNSNGYFTYNNIHKVALLGMVGAILGLGGYNQQDGDYPEFYNILKDLRVSVVPKGKVCPDKKVQVFNNSTMFYNRGANGSGANLIVYEEWIENPCWDIYIQINEDNCIEKELSERLLNSRFVYTPYLGKNDHFANIHSVEKIEEYNVLEDCNSLYINSLYKAKDFAINYDENSYEDDVVVYREFLPVGLTEETNHYILNQFSYTNKKVSAKKEVSVFNVNEHNIVFV